MSFLDSNLYVMLLSGLRSQVVVQKEFCAACSLGLMVKIWASLRFATFSVFHFMLFLLLLLVLSISVADIFLFVTFLFAI